MTDFEDLNLQSIWRGENLLFTFKQDAENFLKKWCYEYEYNDGEFIDQEHFDIKGYKAKIYWIAN